MEKFYSKLILFFLIITSFLITSCENFLEGSELQEEIEKTIWLSQQENLEITEYFPTNQKENYYQNTSISITFNKKMNTSTAAKNILIGSA